MTLKSALAVSQYNTNLTNSAWTAGAANIYCGGMAFQLNDTSVNKTLDYVKIYNTATADRVFLYEKIAMPTAAGDCPAIVGSLVYNVSAVANNGIAYMGNYTLRGGYNYTILSDYGNGSVANGYITGQSATYGVSTESPAKIYLLGGVGGGNGNTYMGTAWYRVQGIYYNNQSLAPPVNTSDAYNVSQYMYPSDINTSQFTALQVNASIIGNTNYTNVSNKTNSYAVLNYGIYTALNNGCWVFYQKTCINTANSTYNMTKYNNSYFYKTFEDYNTYPGYYPYNYSFIDNSVFSTNYSVYNNNYIKFNVFNFSTNSSTYFIALEFNAINSSSATGNMLIYYCNSSYASGNPATSNSCILADSFAPQAYAHTHNNSRHQLIPVTINIPKTQTSYFVFIGTAANVANSWKFSYLTNNSYDNTSFNNGNYAAWAATNHIYDIHVHSFLPSDYHYHNITFYDGNGEIAQSTTMYDWFNVTIAQPSATTLIYPNCSQNITIYSGNINIMFNWTPATDINNLTLNYNLTLYDSLNIPYYIGTTNNTNISYNVSSLTFPPGAYYSTINTCNQFNLCDLGTGCSFNFCENSYSQSIQPCISGARLIAYQDNNHCDTQYFVPADNNTYTNCTETIRTELSLGDNSWIYIFLLFIFIIFFIMAFKLSFFFLVGDGLIMAISSFIIKNTISGSPYSVYIFIFMLLISLIFILGGLGFGLSGRNNIN